MNRRLRARDLCQHLGLQLVGDGDGWLTGPASLRSASASEFSFFSDPRRLPDLLDSRAGAVILSASAADQVNIPCLVSDHPYRDFIKACHLFQQGRGDAPGIHPRAEIHAETTVADTCSIGSNTAIDAGSSIGEGVTIGANCVIGRGVSIGSGTRIEPLVRIYDGTTIGENCNIHSGAILGSPGFGYIENADGWTAVPQVGRLRIGNQVDIGANTTIDRGALDDTVIEDGVKLDNQIQIAHNVIIGAHTAIAGCTGIAGSAIIGKRCKIGGRANILGHLSIADDVVIHATSTVTRSIPAAGEYASNFTVQGARDWRRNLARLMRIDELFRRVRHLEKMQE